MSIFPWFFYGFLARRRLWRHSWRAPGCPRSTPLPPWPPRASPRGPPGASKGSPRGLQGVPPGAAGRLWELLGVPKRIQKKDLRAPLFSWFLFTTLVFTYLNGIRQVASTAIQPAGHNPASQPPRLRRPHRAESKGGGAAVCRREASSIRSNPWQVDR